MKISRNGFSLIAVAFLLGSTGAFAQFSGYFSGYYAPVNWTAFVSGNPLYQDTAFVNTGNAPQSVEIVGAVDGQQQASAPRLPTSVIDYTIVLNGSGLQPVAFVYLFTGLPDGYDKAQLIYNNGSGVQVIANLSALIGVQQTYVDQLQGGRTFGFRVYSNNDSLPDTLVISAIPEPSTVTFLGLGVGALWWKLRRRLS